MRVFIGIKLPDALKLNIKPFSESVLSCVNTNELIAVDNCHITLEFLGEIEDVESLIHQLRSVFFHPFTVSVGSPKTFDKGTHKIIYLPVISDEIQLLRQKVLSSIEKPYIPVNTYTPHITLFRKAFMIKPLSDLDFNASFEVDAFDLFLSHRVAGKLTYTVLHSFPLKRIV
ncbi:MAG: RNA 2',3'-cyclic phosphodiesterase [Acholeplasma sp.]|nr:RNA 2',3'-cyclic phosphodiesterase [Acholeplasma sp.]